METTRDEAIARVVESATRLGVEVDAREAAEWVAAMETDASGGEVVVDVGSGVYGYRVTMLDFVPGDLARFREMSAIVGFVDRPPQVLTALSISGSAAQSKINSYPADCDFFERIHITADTRQDACAILADLIRDKALATAVGPTHRLYEVKFGSHPVAASKGSGPVNAGSPMSWTVEEVRAGRMEVTLPDGAPRVYTWVEAAQNPGWCKLDWVIADKTRGRLANASNVIDPTWEAPDGTIVPLDGFLAPYYQEVYLDSASIPLFSKLVKQLSADSVDDYVDDLEHEVWKYTVKEPNFGKAARRMYNIFRMNGKYGEAAWIRELFDEPVTALYQVSALVRTLDEAASAGEVFDTGTMASQVDGLITEAIVALDGPDEVDMVGHLLKLRDSLRAHESHDARSQEMRSIQGAALRAVNAYFERALRSVPEIESYLEDIAKRAP
ncbi:MAG: hypothetical protein M3067_04210 [Chloroflexota bacterium]|nr:hypothetical protein [Chloroflexota bacterium]